MVLDLLVMLVLDIVLVGVGPCIGGGVLITAVMAHIAMTVMHCTTVIVCIEMVAH